MTWKKQWKTSTKLVISSEILDWSLEKVSNLIERNLKISKAMIEIWGVCQGWPKSGMSIRCAKHRIAISKRNPTINDQTPRRTCLDPPQKWPKRLWSGSGAPAGNKKEQWKLKKGRLMQRHALLYQSSKQDVTKIRAFLTITSAHKNAPVGQL